MPTFEEIIDEVMDAHKSRSKRTYIGCIGSAKALKKTFQNTDASKIVPDDFYSLHVKRLREENPKRNLNNDRKMFIRAMYISYRRGLIRTPPIRIPKPDLEKAGGRELSFIEIKALLNNCTNPELKLQIQLALKTGMRLREILFLRWEYIDLTKGVISLPAAQTKTRRARAFPIARDLILKLSDRKFTKGSEIVFPSRIKAGVPAYDNKKAWKNLLKRTGIKARFHDLRHTSATIKARAGISRSLIARELGMSEKVLSQIYLHLNVEDLRESAEAVALP